ncbi:DNA-binding transcriptional regulator, LysR family [Proteiniborus ethanoligenes]|uniref:DNA-binding transcriptional regulator, LysR family n=1 Tax=Proteiniborus ethanoligenes TaxID=415015 RepID=A0A1H3L8J3_9FIRM|nr:selenium metabolism-associated LysR family transcriptional regulator [Proteiniborus ethanoligenes]SDY60763.1 DNA-binding transcriptional regulator, LysR family [Proteiniborus ethanoligenes]
MDFRQLETFIEVVNRKSFSKAAQKLYLTQPTITSHIQNLENELGTILLNRSGKNVTPTEAGSLLYRHALNIVNMRNMAQFDLGVYKGKVQGHLDISSSSIPKHYVLPYLLKKFTSKYPDVTFSLTDYDSEKVVEGIIDGITDFGIIGAKFNSPQLEYIDLIEDRLVAIVPNNKDYPWKEYEELPIDFLLNKKIILRESGSGTRILLQKKLLEKDLDLDSLNIVAYIEDIEAIKKFVELGVGISFISERAIKKEVSMGSLKPYYIKELDLKRKFYFVYHKKRQLSPLSQTFRDFVIDSISTIE